MKILSIHFAVYIAVPLFLILIQIFSGFLKQSMEWAEEFRYYGALVVWIGPVCSVGVVIAENVEVSDS